MERERDKGEKERFKKRNKREIKEKIAVMSVLSRGRREILSARYGV